MRFEQLYPEKSRSEKERENEERKSSDERFSEAWLHPEPLFVHGTDVANFYDIRPDREKTPVPVLLLGGWTSTAENMKKLMREFVARGRRSITIDTPHGVKYEKSTLHLVDRATNVENRKIASFLRGLDMKHIQRTDAVAHSEGCIDLVLAAASYPERFRNIVLVDPAGMIGRDTLIDLMVRNQLQDVPKIKEARAGSDYQFAIHPDDARYVDTRGEAVRHPINSLQELRSLANIHIDDLLRALKRHGIGIVIVASDEDYMFPIERMVGKPLTHEEDLRARMRHTGEMPAEAEKILDEAQRSENRFVYDERGKLIMAERGTLSKQKKYPDEDIGNIIDGFISMSGLHVTWIDRPKENAQLVDGIFTALAHMKGET